MKKHIKKFFTKIAEKKPSQAYKMSSTNKKNFNVSILVNKDFKLMQ